MPTTLDPTQSYQLLGAWAFLSLRISFAAHAATDLVRCVPVLRVCVNIFWIGIVSKRGNKRPPNEAHKSLS